MNLLPFGQQQRVLLSHHPHGAPNISPAHPVGGEKFRTTGCSAQIDLRLSVTKDVNMRRTVVIDEDDHAQSVCPENGYHDME
jgi:hypothetical protein